MAKDLPAGCWYDRNGDLHFNVRDILAAVGLPPGVTKLDCGVWEL